MKMKPWNSFPDRAYNVSYKKLTVMWYAHGLALVHSTSCEFIQFRIYFICLGKLKRLLKTSNNFFKKIIMSLLCSLKPSIIIKKMQASITPKMYYSGSSNFTVKEIKIPIAATNGHLAGKPKLTLLNALPYIWKFTVCNLREIMAKS